MADDNFRSEIVSKFLLDTCLLQQLSSDKIEALTICVYWMTLHPPEDDEVTFIPLITGSAAEFYIQPMLSCIGDIDIMIHRSDTLAIPERTAPPTRLPAEFHSRDYVGI